MCRQIHYGYFYWSSCWHLVIIIYNCNQGVCIFGILAYFHHKNLIFGPNSKHAEPNWQYHNLSHKLSFNTMPLCHQNICFLLLLTKADQHICCLIILVMLDGENKTIHYLNFSMVYLSQARDSPHFLVSTYSVSGLSFGLLIMQDSK